MAVSNPATLLSVKSEFGGSGALSSYVGAAPGISGSLPISLSSFAGVSASINIGMYLDIYDLYANSEYDDGRLIASWYGFVEGGIGFGGTFGSISPTTFAYAGGATIAEISGYSGYDSNFSSINFTLVGANYPNSGWSAMIIPGYGTLTRESATYYPNNGGFYTSWTWNVGNAYNNPFRNGGYNTITFTP